jgi:hypothetical protein
MRNLMKLFETYIPNNLAEYASAYMRGMGASDHPVALMHHDALDWRYEPAYPLANLNPEIDKAEWMREEIRDWTLDGEPDRYDDMTNGQEIIEPIVVVEIEGGVGEIVDGWHRTGSAALCGRATIPAVVGCARKG